LFFVIILYIANVSVAPPIELYMVFLGIQFAAMGLGYVAATYVPSKQSLILGVVLILVSIIISGYKPSLPQLESDFGMLGTIMPSISYARWGMEGIYLAQVDQYDNIYSTTPVFESHGYKEVNMGMTIFMMFVLGVVFRVLAFIAIKFGK